MGYESILNGTTLLVVALLVSFISLIFLARSASGNQFALVTSRQLYYLTTILIVLTVILLLGAFLNHQYYYAYVYNNSDRGLSLVYRIAAFWAGKEGSFLLWLFILNILGIFVIRSGDENENILISIVMITQIFILLLLVVDSPFKYIWDVYADVEKGFRPADGAGMNPLLADPWMVAHPPVLFLGYASATIPFGYAVAAMLRNEYSAMIERGYSWVLFSMLSLGIGIFLGGYWAYTVLGWGGYWGWDPVENSSLIPWLVVVALMHGMLLQKRKGALVKTNLALSCVYFILVLYSAFLTRSGVLADFSVHSFADYGLTGYFLTFIVFYMFISLFLFFRRFRQVPSKPVNSGPFSWQTVTVYGIIVILCYALFILVGTSMPILSGIFMKNRSAVTTGFYNGISVPFGLLILGLMVASSVRGTGRSLTKNYWIMIAAASVFAGVLFNVFKTSSPVAYLFGAASFFVIIYYMMDLAGKSPSAAVPSRITHMGAAVLVLGVIASGFHSTAGTWELEKGREESGGGLAVTFTGIRNAEKSSLEFMLRNRGREKSIATAYYYDGRTNSMYREPYISCGLMEDLYITPQQYIPGLESVTTSMVRKGQKISLGGLDILFEDFMTRHMTSSEPEIYAVLRVNGRKVMPGMKISSGESSPIKAVIPGTGRWVSLLEVDAGKKIIVVHVSPSKGMKIPPDRVILDVSHKRLIWLVWLGTILISAGAFIALVMKSRAGRQKK